MMRKYITIAFDYGIKNCYLSILPAWSRTEYGVSLMNLASHSSYPTNESRALAG
jgi:hypothetical protein